MASRFPFPPPVSGPIGAIQSVNGGAGGIAAPPPVTTSPQAQPAVASPYTTSTNTTNNDPGLQDFLGKWNEHLKSLQANVHRPNTVDTQRMIHQADSNITDQAAGDSAALDEESARSGTAGTGVSMQRQDARAAAAQRAKAGSAAAITIAQQKAQDEADMVRERALDAFLSGGLGAATAQADMNFRAQGLGLSQQQLQQNAENARADREERSKDRTLEQQLAMLRNPLPSGGGYGGGYYGGTGGVVGPRTYGVGMR